MSTKPLSQRINHITPNFPLTIREVRSSYPNASQPINYHPEIEFQLTKQGAGSYFITDRQYPFRPNTLLIIPSNAVHRFLPSPDRKIHKMTMMVHPRILSMIRTWKPVCQNHGACINLTEDISIEAYHLMQSIVLELSRKLPDWKALVNLKLREFILLVRRAQNQAGASVAVANNPVISQLVSFLDQNFSKPITMAMLSKKTGYTRGYLTRIFKRQAGMGPKQYILHRRISAAQKLLQEDPNLKTATISADVGFLDYSSFHDHFKKITDFTPAAYRTFTQSRRT